MSENIKNLSEGDKDFASKIPGFLSEKLGTHSKNFQILCWIPILYQGWELDEWAALVQVDNEKILLHTDHGNLYQVTDPKEFLLKKSSFYRAASDLCDQATKYL
jgi:hypothetical protein